MKLLAILVGAKSTPACLDAARTAAHSLPHAEIAALHVVVDPETMIAASEEIELQRLRAGKEGSARQRADATRAAFTQWCSQNDSPGMRWTSIPGAEEEIVCNEAKAADVIVLVLAREVNLDSGDALHAAIFRSGKPVLIVPPGWRSGERPRFAHVAVALSNSEATRHAIEGAGPWLRTATRLTAIRIGEGDDAAPCLSHLLSETGVEPALHIVPRSGPDLGAQIVSEAKAVGADLLVAGAYRHSQIVEWLLGGTTRHLLAAADLPILLAH
ncbi:universal stress protein [Sphingomonas sp. PR090111-T3T-6A]|uniref:universal stress protein n=1 Tax=Sphingomonas sp. PR090111-T3T-6A TaxID=685778 RepID=UPI0003680AA0|nr:universal stress protein [Sphingomonas sp. PR090111-T3T-6A]